jgi:hypothetical protein
MREIELPNVGENWYRSFGFNLGVIGTMVGSSLMILAGGAAFFWSALWLMWIMAIMSVHDWKPMKGRKEFLIILLLALVWPVLMGMMPFVRWVIITQRGILWCFRFW